MESFINLVMLAQAAPAAPGGPGAQNPLISFVPFIFIIVIFYFMLIRPQQKRTKEHAKLLSTVKAGDKVIMNSGIHGLVHNVKEKTVIVKVADNVRMEFDKASIGVVDRSSPAVEEETKTLKSA